MSEQQALSAEQQKALVRLAIRREVGRESDKLFERAQGSAEVLRSARLESSQIHNLENIAYSTDRISDIYDFLKKQMGRPGNLGQKWRHKGIGQKLLEDLSRLHDRARKIVRCLKEKYPQGVDEDTERQVHLLLCQEYLKHVAAHYFYAGAVR